MADELVLGAGDADKEFEDEVYDEGDGITTFALNWRSI